jgi:hypothetical protein
MNFTPISKGGGDFQYYLSNPFVLWWDEKSIKILKEMKWSALRSLDIAGKSEIHYSYSSGKTRGRFCISQDNLVSTNASNNIMIIDKKINKFALIGYLNSKYVSFLMRLQTKKRTWETGGIARIPIPYDYIINNSEILIKKSKESYELRRQWDTNYPMSPIYSNSLLDKILSGENCKRKTKHPFCEEFSKVTSSIYENFKEVKIGQTISLSYLIKIAEKKFREITKRLDIIDDEIYKILSGLIKNETQIALNDYYNRFVGEMIYEPEPDIWLRDFLIANLMDIIKESSNGIITFYNQIDNEKGLYTKFIQLLCFKFDLNEAELQPLLLELEQKEYLGKSLENWIMQDFFFYHCKRFGGRPIIWQFTSKQNPRDDGALNIFIDYHKITKNTLSTIRVDIIQPLLTRLEHQRDTGILPNMEAYKLAEIEKFLSAFLELEKGYKILPSPNILTGKNATKGKGDDKTWEWVFGEAAKIIEKGYNPDLFMGVLVNLIPLCLNIPDKNKDKLDIQYKSITPKRTIKAILKKLSALDQLKQKSVKSV